MSLLQCDSLTCWQVVQHLTAMPVPCDSVFLVEHIAVDLGS